MLNSCYMHMQISCNNWMVHPMGFLIISYATNITFVFHPKQSIHIILEMQLPFHTNINNKKHISFPQTHNHAVGLHQ